LAERYTNTQKTASEGASDLIVLKYSLSSEFEELRTGGRSYRTWIGVKVVDRRLGKVCLLTSSGTILG